MNEYLILQSVDPKQNRYRAYCVFMSRVSESLILVKTSWGRISNVQQSSIKVFKDIEAAEGYISQVVKTRQKHGYALIEKTEGFPMLKQIETLPSSFYFHQQASLF